MMKRKIIALLLATTMVTAVFSGCGDSSKENSETSKETTRASEEKEEESKTESQAEESEEKVLEYAEFDAIWFMGSWVPEAYEKWKGTDVYEYMMEQCNVDMNATFLEADQVGVRVASGDLGDMISMHANYINEFNVMVENGQLLPMDVLVEQYAPEIKESDPERWQYFMDNLASEDGHLYCLPVHVGESVKMTDEMVRYLYKVRWDLYKQLGYPEIKNEDDLIEMLKDMMELQPVDENGDKAYGASFYLTDTNYWGLIGPFEGTYQKRSLKNYYVYQDTITNDLYYDMIDVDNSLYWRAVDYYFRCNQAGILDPDCLIQTLLDFEVGADKGSHFSCFMYTGRWGKEDASSFVSLPVEGAGIYDGGTANLGYTWGYAKCVPTTCEDPEAVMRFLNWYMTEEASLAIYRGLEGVHWNYDEEGVPVWTDEYLAARKPGVANEQGIYNDTGFYLAGYSDAYLGYDGYPLDLGLSKKFQEMREWEPTNKEIVEYYNVSYPTQIIHDAVAEGKMTDFEKLDMIRKCPTATEDIERIDATCLKICLEAVGKLVFAKDRNEFEQVKEDTLAQLEAAGAKDAEKFYKDAWADLYE